MSRHRTILASPDMASADRTFTGSVSSRPLETISVSSVPSGHVYVRHVAPEVGPTPLRLPDPDPSAPHRSATERWWPPVMLEPQWVEHAEVDVFHIQFGFDACAPAQLTELVATLRRRGIPLVHTVHDLRNPHHVDRGAHDDQLDVLIPAADALITLTAGAAREIRSRWNREATVLPHPHVVELSTMGQLRAARRSGPAFRVGVHVKSLRASMAPLRILPTLVEVMRSLPAAVLQVNGHRDVLESDGQRYDGELATYLRRAAEAGDIDLRVHDYLSDEQLWAYLSSLDLSVLPYRFGTHSGWLEACRDVGTAVIAPSCGYLTNQGPVLSYVHDEDTYDAASLAAAVVEAYETRPDHGVTVEQRRKQRRQIAEAHHRLYQSLAG